MFGEWIVRQRPDGSSSCEDGSRDKGGYGRPPARNNASIYN